MTDIAGKEIKLNDWIVYATRSRGKHSLKFAKVKYLPIVERPRGRYYNLGVTIESFDCNDNRYTATIQPEYILVIPESLVPTYWRKLYY